MDIQIREYTKEDTKEAIRIWNHIVEEGNAFPQMDCLTESTGEEFFLGQSYTGIAVGQWGDCRPVHPASQSCGKVRTYLQCQLRGQMGLTGLSDWRKAGTPLYGTGEGAGVWYPPV